MDFKLEGMDQLLNHIASLGIQIDGTIKSKAIKAGAEVAREKIARHPNMPRSELSKEHAQDNIIIQKVSNDQWDIGAPQKFFYLLFHEIGTTGGKYKASNGSYYTSHSIPAKPFMRPAFESSKDEITRAMKAELKRGLGL